jgi:hypothetical protein
VESKSQEIKMTNFLKGYRTVLFSIATILVSLAELTDIVSIATPEYLPLLLLLVGIGNLLLRFITDTPVGGYKKE